MSNTIQARKAPGPSEVLDRDNNLTFTFNGKRYAAFSGDTIASALAASGVTVFSRSFKYHRPRGLLCCAGHCPNCLVQVGDEPNVRACQRAVQQGMSVSAQNAWPSLDRDLLSATAIADRLLPVGFYYKTFIRPQALWPVYEHVLRHIAGLGKISSETEQAEFDKQYLHADIVVIGGGPAGISAARAASEQGAQVLLFEENPALGGHLLFASPERANALPPLLDKLQRCENITTFTDTTVLGWYEEHWLSAVRGSRLFKIRAKAIVVATGAYETPLVFDNNDLPGVMLGSAVQRLLNLYSVVAGQRSVIITTNDEGWEVAADLHAAGVNLAAVVDARGPDDCASVYVDYIEGLGEVPIFWSHTIVSAQGSKSVKGAVIAPVADTGSVNISHAQTISCDLISMSMGWTPASGLLYQAGGQLSYDKEQAAIMPVKLSSGVYGTGRVNGTYEVANQISEGRLTGLRAASFLGLCDSPSSDEQSTIAACINSESSRNSDLVLVPGKKKRFVCYCEDVTDVDIETAIAEGYSSIELLKRYSTISMGPCQGKMCSMNTIHLCARANEATIDDTGTTTARPPASPVSLGALAGQNMEPVQVTPIHEWHLGRDAKMMVSGLWLRPEHYGDPTTEIRAVREHVGLIDVSTLGKLQLTGTGVPDLLERLYVNRWRKLHLGRVRYGVMCNDEGVVMDDGVCARMDTEEWYMTTTSGGASAVFDWIQWWTQSGWGDDVHIVNRTEDFAAFNLAGPQSRALLQELVNSTDISNEAFPYMHVRPVEVAGASCYLLRIGFTGELSYEIHVPSGYGLHVWQALMQAGQRFGIMPFGMEAQRVLRLEKAHIIVGQDTDALTDPIAADMSWIVKLDKADFLGKRPLARIADEGTSQRLAGFKMVNSNAIPDEGTQIVQSGDDGKIEIIGWVTSSRFSPTLCEGIGLCWLPTEIAAQNKARFTIRTKGRLEEAYVHHGAFYDPHGERLRM